ncbi:hypothetical protein H5410_035577 [Solanum commersonii]|uniref:Uncharacterized protein n=1 Tax=Solanum commersonii TaxID=4109 RepID=A0A9J5Y1N3_SOLCO|nr:hypothetical protein H5410_035577 [Solanum commersonii]
MDPKGKNVASDLGTKRSRKGAIPLSSNWEPINLPPKNLASKLTKAHDPLQGPILTVIDRQAHDDCWMGPRCTCVGWAAFQEPIDDDDATADKEDGLAKDESDDIGPGDDDTDVGDGDARARHAKFQLTEATFGCTGSAARQHFRLELGAMPQSCVEFW